MKDDLLSTLKQLIDLTHLYEQEQKQLKESYEVLRLTVDEIIAVLPSAIWILNEDESIFIQNKMAQENELLFKAIDIKESYYELDLDDKCFQVKIINKNQKIIIMANDISEEKRKQRLASMGQIAAHLGHEIRNPICSISLLLDLFEEESENKDLILQMKQAISRVERIIKSTLLFSKGIKIRSNRFCIKDLEKDCLEVFENYELSLGQIYKINFKISLPSLFIEADKELLFMVFSNLIYNAVDAIYEKEEEGYISFYAKKEGSLIVFFVEDSGVEIEDPSSLFEAYKTSKLKGNGLGLSLSHEIMQAHGGKIYFRPSPKGFCVELNAKI